MEENKHEEKHLEGKYGGTNVLIRGQTKWTDKGERTVENKHNLEVNNMTK
jgi:hypothetical protein